MEELQQNIEARLAGLDPEVELVMLERPAAESLRIYVDHPGGVDLALCERVTEALGDLLANYTLEVSSPGIDRPLTKPEHFQRYLGSEIRVKTSQPIDGQRNFTGRLTAADETAVSLDADGRAVTIPLADVHRSNLVPQLQEASR
jgi:ribosome maturation factor RimP